MSSKLKVGIVGCGIIARERHIPRFLKLKGKVELQAVCDTNNSLAQEMARQYGIPKAYSSLSEMVSKENLDIVDICTPPQVHTPLAVEAMEHGCHILLEKPMALKTSDCDQMIAASRKNGVKLSIIHNVLFHPPFLKARKLVAEGAIGRFTGMRIFNSDPTSEMLLRKDYWVHKLPGGLIGETGPHTVYMSLAFLNRVKSVDIYAKNFLEHPWAPFDEFRIELEGEEAMSSIAVSYTGNRHALYVDIIGTEGLLHLDLLSMLLIRQGNRESMKPMALARYSLGYASQIVGCTVANAFRVVTGRAKIGHDVVIERFVDSVRDDREPPVTPEEGRETTRVMEMVVARLREKYGDERDTLNVRAPLQA